MKNSSFYWLMAICLLCSLPLYGETVSGIENGHEYVDLGLPSGTLWATCNVGATTPEGYGNHYAWGETEPKSEYTKENYKYVKAYTKDFDDKTYYAFTKYCYNSDYGYNGFVDNKTVLDPEDDVAHVKWGGQMENTFD